MRVHTREVDFDLPGVHTLTLLALRDHWNKPGRRLHGAYSEGAKVRRCDISSMVMGARALRSALTFALWAETPDAGLLLSTTISTGVPIVTPFTSALTQLHWRSVLGFRVDITLGDDAPSNAFVIQVDGTARDNTAVPAFVELQPPRERPKGQKRITCFVFPGLLTQGRHTYTPWTLRPPLVSGIGVDPDKLTLAQTITVTVTGVPVNGLVTVAALVHGYQDVAELAALEGR